MVSIDGRGIEGADELRPSAVRFLLRIILQVPVATKESTRESSGLHGPRSGVQ